MVGVVEILVKVTAAAMALVVVVVEQVEVVAEAATEGAAAPV